MFDANALIQATVTQANETKRDPCPVGDYIGQIGALKIDAQMIKKGERAGEVMYKLTFPLQVENDPKLAAIGMKKISLRGEILLDLTANGVLDMGKNKNLALGRLREALGQNQGNMPWNLGMIVGQMLKFTVEHRPDDKNPELVYDQTKGYRSPTSPT